MASTITRKTAGTTLTRASAWRRVSSVSVHRELKLPARTLMGIAAVVVAIVLPHAYAFNPLVGPRAGLQAKPGYTKNNAAGSSTAAAESVAVETLPPGDETWSSVGAAIEELLAAPEYPQGTQRYDGIGKATGGIWRSRVLGIVPSTVMAAPLATKWASKQETAGNIVEGWPPSFGMVIGEKSITKLGSLPKAHASARSIFLDALSPRAVIELQPMVENTIEKYISRWEKSADSGEETAMLKDIYGITLEIISRCFLGAYATEEVLEDLRRVVPVLGNGVLSVPIRFPWPLNKFAAFSFGLAMDARAELVKILAQILSERRSDIEADGERRQKSGGAIDSFLEMQAKQIVDGVLANGIKFDDDFVIDNFVMALFAGFDTTSVALTRTLQLLATPDAEGIADKLREELDASASVEVENNVDANEKIAKTVGKGTSGIFAMFPLLESVILESSRMYPIVPGAFRKVLRDISFNNFKIPAGTTISWNVLSGYRADSLYPEPKKFCPFRFLHGGKSENAADVGHEQPRPPMWGYGRHMCPGRELAKMEIAVFFKMFLEKFHYTVVAGQSLKNTLPVNAPQDKLRVVLEKRIKSG